MVEPALVDGLHAMGAWTPTSKEREKRHGSSNLQDICEHSLHALVCLPIYLPSQLSMHRFIHLISIYLAIYWAGSAYFWERQPKDCIHVTPGDAMHLAPGRGLSCMMRPTRQVGLVHT